MVSNEVYVNITRESSAARPAGRYAAPLPGAGGNMSSYFMVGFAAPYTLELTVSQPLWPAELFAIVNPARHGEWLVPDLVGARYDFGIVRQSLPHDVVRQDYCTNPITFNTTDAVGMNVSISANADNSSYLHIVTLCLRDLDQNNVYIAPINFSLGRVDAKWSRGDAGNMLESVAGFRPLNESETVGDWRWI
jgi:hypothetical protein